MRDRRYSWSWRCCSTNGVHSIGLLRPNSRRLQDLLELTASQAIRKVCARWPEADARLQEEHTLHGEERNEEIL